MITVEILSIGTELLIGDVLNTNAHWLIRQVTGLGGHVRRAVIIRDDPDAIGLRTQVLTPKPQVHGPKLEVQNPGHHSPFGHWDLVIDHFVIGRFQ